MTADHVIEASGPARPATDAVRPLADLLRAPGTRVVVLATSKDVNAKVTLMVVPPGHDRPAAVVKVATTPGAAGAVLAERAALQALHATGASIVAATVPRLLARYDADGLPAVASTAMPGRPLRTTYHQWRHTARPAAVRRDFALAADWLADLQRQTAGEWAGITLLADALAGVARRFPADARAERATGRLDRWAGRLAAVGAPVTAVHGDYWHGNLLAGPGGIAGVVDWESGTAAGDPLRDVVRFPLGYALYLDRHTRPGRVVAGHPGLRAGDAGGGVAHAVLGNGWFPALVRDVVTGALERLGVPARWWRAVLLAGIAEIAVTADHPDFAELHLDLLDRLALRCTDAGLLP